MSNKEQPIKILLLAKYATTFKACNKFACVGIHLLMLTPCTCEFLLVLLLYVN